MRVTANLATFSERTDVVGETIDSLQPQVDEVRVYANECTVDSDNAKVVQGEDRADNGKFYFVSDQSEYYFSCDDDIRYPPNYVEWTLERLKSYPECIVTYHGRRLLGKKHNYYRGHENFNCRRTLADDINIDIPGTGVTAFHTDVFSPDIADADDKRMADILIGLEAAKQGVPVICLAHSPFWIQVHHDGGYNIYDDEVKDDSRQAELANRIYEIKYM